MQSSNHGLEQFFRYYTDKSRKVPYAFLLNGPWGSGKTHQVRQLIKEATKDETLGKKRFTYISLFGIDSIQTLNSSLVAAAALITENKLERLAFKFGGSVLRAFSVEFSPTIQDIPALEENHVFVFDDLERCDIPAQKLLGYINQLIEHDNFKAIIIANEEEIKQEEYWDFKEKVVGQTILFNSVPIEAQKHFVTLLNDNHTRVWCNTEEKLLAEIYAASEITNLRLLRQALMDLEKVFSILTETHRSNKAAITELAYVIIVLSLEFRNKKEGPTTGDASPLSPFQQVLQSITSPNRFPQFVRAKFLPSEQIAVALFVNGIIDVTQFRSELDQSAWFLLAKEQPAWMRLWNVYELTSLQFADGMKEVESDLRNFRYVSKDDILQCYGLRLFLARVGLLPLSVGDILAEGKAYIDRSLERGLLLPSLERDVIAQQGYFATHGLGAHERESAEFKILLNYVEDAQGRAAASQWPEQALGLLHLLTTDLTSFTEAVGNHSGRYFNIPVFAGLPTDAFVKKILELPPSERRKVMGAFASRYQRNRPDLNKERPWAYELRTKLEKLSANMTPVEAFQVRSMIDWALPSVTSSESA